MRIKEGNKAADIYSAAVKIFALKGYHNAKVSDIAAEAGVAAGSVYLYYRNKEDIIIQIFSKIWTDLTEELLLIRNNPAFSPLEKIDHLIDHYFNIFRHNPNLAIVYAAEHRNALEINQSLVNLYNRFLDSAETLLEEGKITGVINKDIDVKVFRFFLLGGMRLLIDTWARNLQSPNLDQIRKSVKQIVRNGII